MKIKLTQPKEFGPRETMESHFLDPPPLPGHLYLYSRDKGTMEESYAAVGTLWKLKLSVHT